MVRCGASALADFYNASRAALYFLSEGPHSPERHSGGVKGPPLGPFSLMEKGGSAGSERNVILRRLGGNLGVRELVGAP